jgi:hypothetical protein
MEDGWFVLETKEKIPFGEIIASFYNHWSNVFEVYQDEKSKLFNAGFGLESKEMQQFEENYPGLDENFYILNNFINTIKSYLTNNNKQNIKAIHTIDTFLLASQKEIPPFLVSSHYINKKWYPAYEVNEDNEIFFAMLDLQEIRNIDNLDFAFCKYCNKLYIKRSNRNKYCSNCSNNYKSINDKLRKNSPRGLHHKVSTYIRNSYKFTTQEQAEFLNESNYYWDILNNKASYKKNNYLDIKNENDYIKWLENKHQEFKTIAKTKTKC